MRNEESEKKRRRGHPAFYETPVQLREAVERYLMECEENEVIPSSAGLSYALGFVSRMSFNLQSRRGEDFAEIVYETKIRLYCIQKRITMKSTEVII